MAGDASPAALIPPERAGWEARYVGSEPRLSEVAGLYRELGFEVRIEPYVLPPDCGECKTCLESAGEGMRVVYVRKTEKKPEQA